MHLTLHVYTHPHTRVITCPCFPTPSTPRPLPQTLRTFLGKAFGVSFAIGSGLFAGKEGPFIVSAHGCTHGANSFCHRDAK